MMGFTQLVLIFRGYVDDYRLRLGRWREWWIPEYTLGWGKDFKSTGYRANNCLYKDPVTIKTFSTASMLNYIWLVPNFGGLFSPIFGQEKYESLTTTIRTLFDGNS